MTRVRMPGLLDGELQEIARLRVRAGQYQLSADDVSQATLTIPEDGPVVGLRDWVSLYDVDGLMGIYRVTNIAQTVKRSIQLTLLHGIDILADSYWAEEREYTGNVRGYLEALLAQQTALIDGTAPWALGDCEDTETQLKVKISYGRLSELIREAVPEGGGYQLEYDQTVWPWRVHLRAKPTAAAAEFRVARNITSATITYSDADLCTVLILSNTSGGESRVRVYNAGAIAQAEWGFVTKPASIDTSDTLTSDSWPEAEAWVANFFRLHAAPSVQIQIEGRELYRLTGDRWDRASLGRVCRVSLPEYGHTFEERVVSLTYPDPWGDPDRVVVSLANALPQFSEQVKLIEKTAKSASRAAGGAARKADQTAEELERKEVIYQTSFQKTDREIAGIASATGLQFNADGTPVLDEDGNFVYDEDNPENSIYSQLILAAGNITSLTETTSGLSSRISQTESDISAEVTNRTNADADLSSRITANATAITAEVNRASAAEGALSGRITVNADAISSEVTRAQGAEDALSSRITQNATSIAAKVSAGDVATQLAVEVGNVTITGGNLVVDGMITSDSLSTINISTTGYLIASEIEAVNILRATTIDCENGGIFAGSITTGEGGEEYLHGTAVIDTQVVPDGSNGYKLQKKMYGSTSWTDAGSFSRAAQVSNVSGTWNGSTLTVAADPNSASASYVTNISAGVKLSGTVPAGTGTITLGYNSTDHKYYIRGQAFADGTEVAGINTTTGTEAYTAGKDTGWNDAADAISWPTGSTASVAVTGPLAGGYNDTGTVKTLYLVDDTTNSKILLRDVNSASASGNTYAEKVYSSGGMSIDGITVENNPISATLVTESGTRYAQGTASLTAWNYEDMGSVILPTALASDTDPVKLNIESILTSAEAAAVQGVNLSGWQRNSSSLAAENLVRNANNATMHTVSLPPAANWRVDVGAFNSSGSATITVSPVLGNVTCNPVTTSTISDSNLKPENIKSGVTIFGKTGTYSGASGSYTQATVTLQGEAENVYIPSSGGTAYYEANTEVERYMGNGGSFTVQGVKETVTTLGTKYWFKYHPSTETPTGAWYTRHTSDPGGSFSIYYASGSSVDYYKAGTVTKYDRGTKVTITPIKSSAMIQVASGVRYKQGVTDSTTYYTRNS